MNNKKAKKLRGKALTQTKGIVNVAYVNIKHLGKRNQVVLDSSCSRAIYKKLKNNYKKRKQNAISKFG